MKKIILLPILACLVCACSGTMQGLRVHNAGKSGKQEINGGLYYNDLKAVGHTEQVKHKIIDDMHAQIQIPVQYHEKMVPLPKKLPSVLKSALKEYDLKSPGICFNSCSLTTKEFTLDLAYARAATDDCSGFYVAFLLWPLLPITVPMYVNECTGIRLENNKEEITILNPFQTLNEKNLGVQIGYEVSPQKMKLNCARKYCELLDEKGSPVNQIHIVKKMSVDQKRINQLLAEQTAAANKRKHQKEEEEKLIKQGEKICPQLYDEMWGSGLLQYRKNDVIAYSKWAKQWKMYYCDSWLRKQIAY